jgi:hypothetical protein
MKLSNIFHLSLLTLLLATASVKAQNRPVELMQRIHLVPQPQKLTYHQEKIPFPRQISIVGINQEDPAYTRTAETIDKVLGMMPDVERSYTARFSFKIQFINDPFVVHKEGYRLVSAKDGINVFSREPAGAFYAAQTIYQLLAYSYFGVDLLSFGEIELEKDARKEKYVPLLTIEDWPAYGIRSVMIDLGRAAFPVPLIKRIITIMSHLKLNTLHLHLYDDQLMGYTFQNLPLGKENPYAIDAADLKEIVRYARSHYVSIMPELESWGHVQSVIHHYPELCGGPGMWGGSSFGIGEKTYSLLEKMYTEIIPCLEDTAMVHVGLDEALWAVLPGEENNGHSPPGLVKRIYDILTVIGNKHGKQITMHLWADHGGRPIPEEIQQAVVVEPWKYRETDQPEIIETLKLYGGENKTPFMMGAGVSSIHFDGDYEATRIWCQEGKHYPNAVGVTICIWGTNDIAGRLITLYAGADFAWTPDTPAREKTDILGENLRNLKHREMRQWQIIFPDANPDQINSDRGPEVYQGRYVWPPMAGKPVAPTVDFVPKHE